MKWNWEDMTAPIFAEAVETTGGVCVVPIGVIEKHGDHLPLGTDTIAVRAVAERATETEPAVIFPPYYFGQIHEAKHCPGTVAIRMRLAFDLLENVCEEIARNGLRKIILLDGHGGNRAFLGHFIRTRLEERRDYQVYLAGLNVYHSAVLQTPEWKAMMETPYDFHGGESETSHMLAIRPECVHMDALSRDPESGRTRGRLAGLPGETAIGWYADYPDHYAGDARPATSAKGEFLLARYAERVAAMIRAVREDTCVAELEKDFFVRVEHGCDPRE